MPASASPRSDIERYRQNLKGEVDGAATYRLLAEVEQTPELAEVYRRLAAVEDRHADVWRSKLREAGALVPLLEPTVRVRFMGWLARRFGAGAVLPMITAREASDTALYNAQPEARAVGM